ncbi:MAG: hypothetical protein JNM66_30040 [Bryobacterales bacterium]|nr:hypothetical protein [Bryobacterales bacterium]
MPCRQDRPGHGDTALARPAFLITFSATPHNTAGQSLRNPAPPVAGLICNPAARPPAPHAKPDSGDIALACPPFTVLLSNPAARIDQHPARNRKDQERAVQRGKL